MFIYPVRRLWQLACPSTTRSWDVGRGLARLRAGRARRCRYVACGFFFIFAFWERDN
jgi:hypothetical protein